MIGSLAMWVERPLRKIVRYDFVAGVVGVVIVVAATGLSTWGLLAVVDRIHPVAYYALSAVLLYTTIAAHDLAAHSNAVYKQLAKKDIAGAREAGKASARNCRLSDHREDVASPPLTRPPHSEHPWRGVIASPSELEPGELEPGRGRRSPRIGVFRIFTVVRCAR